MSEWIDAIKFLPPFYKKVWIYIGNAENMHDIYIGYLAYNGVFCFNQTKEGVDNVDIELVTHWMPLPLPPK